ncbi:MAG TPA: NAD(P)H-binding protein [Polyangia bacterium]|jgi:uncharacterized protein YbjT (DUF2867 family)|nr:NAD(P)H-binding protein [Polyangia bacterium]
MSKLLVTGATGNVGGELYRLLRDRGADVRAVVRDRDHPALRDARAAGADIAVADLDRPETIPSAAAGASAAFVLGGRRDMPGLLGALAGSGVGHVVLLTSRSVIGGVAGNAIVDMWTASEDAVRGASMSWTILRPSGFMSNVERWLPQLRAGDVVRVPFGEVPIAAIDPADIAAVAAAALTDRRHASRALELSGPAPLRPAEQLAALGRALGRELRLESLTGERARAELASVFLAPFVEAQVRFFERGEFDDARVVPTVPDVLGRPARTFAQWLAAHTPTFDQVKSTPHGALT